MAWTYTDDYSLLPNIYVRKYTNENNELQLQLIYPCTGYVLRLPYLDEYKTDEDGNIILDENGNPVIVPYRTYGGGNVSLNYDWQANPNGYCAELYEEGMIVFGNNPDHEVM